jgi:hypothetical protein
VGQQRQRHPRLPRSAKAPGRSPDPRAFATMSDLAGDASYGFEMIPIKM